eukprot:13321.XXX_149950_150123_1 [CDS] Oithona nana genome sequencing.
MIEHNFLCTLKSASWHFLSQYLTTLHRAHESKSSVDLHLTQNNSFGRLIANLQMSRL